MFQWTIGIEICGNKNIFLGSKFKWCETENQFSGNRMQFQDQNHFSRLFNKYFKGAVNDYQ